MPVRRPLEPFTAAKESLAWPEAFYIQVQNRSLPPFGVSMKIPTLQIVENFYTQLKKGHSKSTALRLAKMQQIEEGDRFHAHPVYWAALAPIGDSERIFGTRIKYIWMVGVPLVLFIGGLFWVGSRKKALSPKAA